MCKVSDKLKLCSCKTEIVETLKHYWILSRPNGTEGNIIGEIMPPAYIGEQMEHLNESTLRKLLNNGNCFDVELKLQENDTLSLHFTCYQNHNGKQLDNYYGNYLVYAVKYINGTWRQGEWNYIGGNGDDVQSGKIMKPFLKLENL
ncbi:MAG: hypothetical protein WCI97_06125 [Bacteroidota bacterium]